MSSSSIGMELSGTSLQFGFLFYALFPIFFWAYFSLFTRMSLDDMTFLPLFLVFFITHDVD